MMENYEKLERLGSGGQGKILKVKDKKNGKIFACKMVNCAGDSPQEMNFALKEGKMLRECRHKNIIRYRDFFIYKDRYEDIFVCLVTEYCQGGDLGKRIKAAKREERHFSQETVLDWMKQCSQALHYLHSNKILHRDLKPSNVFFANDNHVKLGDFGLSTPLSSSGKQSVVGTPFYLPPEMMLQQKYDEKVDMWGLGIALTETLTLKERPVNRLMIVGNSVFEEIGQEILDAGYSPALRDLTLELLSRNPEERPTAKEVLEKISAMSQAEAQVPGDYLTISEAIAKVPEGATIRVARGVYTEPLLISKRVEILCEKGVEIEVEGKSAVTVAIPTLPVPEGTKEQEGSDGRIVGAKITQVKRQSRPPSAEGNPSLSTTPTTTPSSGSVQKSREGGTRDKFVAVDIRSCGQFSVIECDIVAHSGACLVVHPDARPTISNCTIHHGKQAGVYFDGGKGCLKDCDVFNNMYAGVLLKHGASPTILRNRIRDGQETGAFICHASSGEIRENTISGNKGSGVVIKGSTTDPTITENLIHANHQAGIFVCDKGLGKIRGNEIKQNCKAAVLIKTQGNPHLTENRILEGEEAGVYVFEKGEGVLERNHICDNKNAGVLITTGANPTLTNNSIHRNAYEGVWICSGGRGVILGNNLSDNKQGPIDIEEECRKFVREEDNQGEPPHPPPSAPPAPPAQNVTLPPTQEQPDAYANGPGKSPNRPGRTRVPLGNLPINHPIK